jgi:hypothetical protein
MGLALFYQLKRSIDLGIIEEGDVLPPSRWVPRNDKSAPDVRLTHLLWILNYGSTCIFAKLLLIIYNGTCTPTLFNRNSSLHAVSLNGDSVEYLHYWLEVNFSFVNQNNCLCRQMTYFRWSTVRFAHAEIWHHRYTYILYVTCMHTYSFYESRDTGASWRSQNG